MAVSIKSRRDIELMREAGRILALTHEEMRKAIVPGISTYELDQIGEQFIRSFGCIPSFLNYAGFPASACISINDEVIHGIPSKDKILKEGDIVSIDCGVIYKGFHSDSARTYGVGKISEEAEKLIEVTKQSFFEGIKNAVCGNHILDISNGVYRYVTDRGYSSVENYVGHGVGRHLHEAPEVPNFPTIRKGIKLRPGMTLAVEPMINIGRKEVKVMKDGWLVKTKDGSLSAHYENTIVITENGEPEILSRAEGVEL